MIFQKFLIFFVEIFYKDFKVKTYDNINFEKLGIQLFCKRCFIAI